MLKSWAATESAASAVEYALLLGFVVVVSIVLGTGLGGHTQDTYRHVSQSFQHQQPAEADATSDQRASPGVSLQGKDPPHSQPRGVLHPLWLAMLALASAVTLILVGTFWLHRRRRVSAAATQPQGNRVTAERRVYQRRQRTLQRLGSQTARLFQARLVVGDLMSEDITVAMAGTRRAELDRQMRNGDHDHAYVCAGDGRLLGIVRRDQLARTSGGDAARLMDSDVPTVDAEAPVSQAITKMLNEHHCELAVVGQGLLRGEITLTDLAIGLQCILQLLLRMGQLVDNVAPVDDEDLQAAAQLHKTQQSHLRDLADQLRDLKQTDTEGRWQQVFERADWLVESGDRLLKGLQRSLGQVDQRMNRLVDLLDTRTDELTGVGNARALDESLTYQCALWKRYDQPVSLLLLQFQAPALPGLAADSGEYDQRLRTWALWLAERVRDTDVVTRYTDQLFAIVLPHTDHDSACSLRDRLHRSLFGSGLGSASMAVVAAEQSDTASQLLSRAQRALDSHYVGGRL